MAGGWDPNATECELVPSWKVGPFELHDPCMVLCAGAGIVVGVLSSSSVVSNKKQLIESPDVQQIYAMTFAAFALMNASGLLNWSVFESKNSWVLLVDCFFSSCTSLNFALCALTEPGWLHMRTKSGQFERTVFLYILIFSGYYAAFFKGQTKWINFLYSELTRYASAFYFVVIVLRMLFRNRWGGVLQLVASIVVGISGLNILGDAKAQAFLCHWLNGWFYGMDIWYHHARLVRVVIFAADLGPDVDPCEVEHGEGAHGKTKTLRTEGSVHLRGRGALLHEASGLLRVGLKHAVADESKAIAGEHGRLADGLAHLHGSGDRRLAGLFAPDVFEQGHHVGRREKVRAKNLFRAARRLADHIHVQVRGIGAQQSLGLATWAQAAKDVLLERHVFEDGLDHSVAVLKRSELGIGGGRKQAHALGHVFVRHLARAVRRGAFVQRFNGVHGSLDGLLACFG